MRSDHTSVVHHGCGDGLQVPEDIFGLTGAQVLDLSQNPIMGLNAPGFTQHLLVSSSGVALTQRARRPAKEKEVKKAMLESVGGIKTVWESNNAALVCSNICSP